MIAWLLHMGAAWSTAKPRDYTFIGIVEADNTGLSGGQL